MASSTALSFVFFVLLFLHRGASFLEPTRIRVLESCERIQLQSVTGPESLAFDSAGGGPYTGVSDGRILKWESDSRKWVQFAVPANGRNGKLCDGSAVDALEDRCGRPLGLQFHRETGDLYIADAYHGLTVVGAAGGVAAPLAAGVEDNPFVFVNGVDVDQETGLVYFTHTSTQFRRRDWIIAIAAEDATGAFLRYDPRTKKTQVLGRDLQFPNGVAVSEDGRFVVVAETTRKRLLRYWVNGPAAGKVEVFARLPGFPDNVKRNLRGEFWVGVTSLSDELMGVKLDACGRILELLRDNSTSATVSEVLENNGTLWLGSIERSFVGACSL